MTEFILKEKILYEDNDLIAINKPSGVLSIEDGYDRNKLNLRTTLNKAYGKIWTVHRLDKYTSGVILFAKKKESHRQLNLSFANREPEKNYRAIVNGFPVWDSFDINLPLKVNGDRDHRTIFDPVNGKPASTRIIRLSSTERYSYFDIFPSSGLTHQIRAHLSASGFPIFGDRLYWYCCDANGKSDFPFSNFFLHALSITFRHPVLNKHIQISAPMPLLFSTMLDELKLCKNC